MSDEHGWPDFTDDPGHHDHHDAGGETEPGAAEVWHEEPSFGHDDVGQPDEPGWEQPADPDPEPEPQPEPEPEPASAVVDITGGHAMGPVGTDPDAAADAGHDPAGVFPPALDVGPLPEPVDGFPWIDTGSLGVVDAVAAPVEPVAAADLAGYAAEDLPPAVDPWEHLAGSQDPATSALARWWRDNG